MGAAESAADPVSQKPVDPSAAPRLDVRELSVANDKGTLAVSKLSLAVRPGEIVGIAGISGNGQRELTEALLGQRQSASGEIRINGARCQASRREMQREKVFSLPEEPLRNACIAGMSVADNLAPVSYTHLDVYKRQRFAPCGAVDSAGRQGPVGFGGGRFRDGRLVPRG